MPKPKRFHFWIMDKSVAEADPGFLRALNRVESGTIIFAPPGFRIVEVFPGSPSRVISFEGVSEAQPILEEKGRKLFLTSEGLKVSEE